MPQLTRSPIEISQEVHDEIKALTSEAAVLDPILARFGERLSRLLTSYEDEVCPQTKTDEEFVFAGSSSGFADLRHASHRLLGYLEAGLDGEAS